MLNWLFTLALVFGSSPVWAKKGLICADLFPNVQKILVVDGMSSGNLIAPEASKRGLEVYHLQSDPKLNDPYFLETFNKGDYKDTFMNDIPYPKLLQLVRELGIDVIVPGAEIGVQLADRLSHDLGLKGNAIELAEARRDKTLMMKAGEDAKLDTPRSFESGKLDEVLAWVDQHGKFPIYMKPVDSMGGFGGHLVHSREGVKQAFRRIIGSIEPSMGRKIDRLLVQEDLGNREFFVDVTSYRGIHAVAAVVRYYKEEVEGAGRVYWRDSLRAAKGREQNQIIPYVLKYLDALGIQYGASHFEVMLTDRGPVIVENNSRVSGAKWPYLTEIATGQSAVTLLIESWVNPSNFARLAAKDYEVKINVENLFLRTPMPGVYDPAKIAVIKKLPSFIEFVPYFQSGQTVPRTVDSATLIGQVLLKNSDANQLKKDLEVIEQLQADAALLKYD